MKEEGEARAKAIGTGDSLPLSKAKEWAVELAASSSFFEERRKIKTNQGLAHCGRALLTFFFRIWWWCFFFVSAGRSTRSFQLCPSLRLIPWSISKSCKLHGLGWARILETKLSRSIGKASLHRNWSEYPPRAYCWKNSLSTCVRILALFNSSSVHSSFLFFFFKKNNRHGCWQFVACSAGEEEKTRERGEKRRVRCLENARKWGMGEIEIRKKRVLGFIFDF